MNDQQLMEWFREQSIYLKIDRIAKELDIPGRTLKAWADGDRPLPDKHKEKIRNWIEQFLPAR